MHPADRSNEGVPYREHQAADFERNRVAGGRP